MFSSPFNKTIIYALSYLPMHTTRSVPLTRRDRNLTPLFRAPPPPPRDVKRVHCHVYRNPPPNSILGQIHPVHTHPTSNPFQYYTPTQAYVFEVVSSFQVFQTTLCTHLSTLPSWYVPLQFIPLHLTVQVTADYAYQLWSSSLYPFLQLNSYLLHATFLFSACSSQKVSIRVHHSMRQTILHAYIKRQTIILCTFLDKRFSAAWWYHASPCLRERSFALLLQLFNTQLGHVRYISLATFKPNSFLHASGRQSDQPTQSTLQSFLRS
jgi:hypothetical protein